MEDLRKSDEAIYARLGELQLQFDEVSKLETEAGVAVTTRIMNQMDTLKWVLGID